MAKTKGKKKVKNNRFAAILSIIILGLGAAHFLDIFTLDDWKELLGSNVSVHTDETAEIHFIDVGQGDCSLIVSEGKTLLIDTGEKENAEQICEYLREHNIEKIDYMLLTHQHSDHMGGASLIIDSMDVENIIIPKLPDDMTPTTKFYEKFLKSVKNKGLKITAAKPGDNYTIGECSLEILAPVEKYDDLNNFSAAAMLTHGENKFFFSGDIEKKAEKDIIKTGRLTEVDVYKAAHHGSSTSNCKDILEILDPDYAVIMCGDGNSYNHPNSDVVERISKYTDMIFRTDLDGTIIFTSSEDGLSYKTEKGE